VLTCVAEISAAMNGGPAEVKFARRGCGRQGIIIYWCLHDPAFTEL
jgi:hypothetical protein